MSTKSELKENVLASHVERWLMWALVNRGLVLTIVGIGFAAILIASVFVIRRREMRDMAWTRIAQAQAAMAQGQPATAQRILQELKSGRAGGSEEAMINYQLGLAAMALNNHEEAAAAFSEAIELSGDSSLKPLALSNLAQLQENKGDFAAAAATYRRFMDQYPEHFLAPRIQLALGRSLLQSGNESDGRQALEQLVDLYPTSHWAEEARPLLKKASARPS